MDAQQELFIALKTALEAKGYDVYDGELPAADVPYPFIYLGASTENDRSIKAGVVGSVSQTIHVYHNSVRERGTLSAILADVKQVCRTIGKSGQHFWSCTLCSQQIVPDNTTRTPLLHGIRDADFNY